MPNALANSVFQDAANGADAVAPADFFAFGVGASMIRHSHFVDADSHFSHFSRDLWLETEAVFFNLDFLNDLASENFVAGLHVGEIEVGEHVAERGQEGVSDRMPEVEDPVFL